MRFAYGWAATCAVVCGLLVSAVTGTSGTLPSLVATLIVMTIGFVAVTIYQCLEAVIRAEQLARQRRDASIAVLHTQQRRDEESLALSRQLHAKTANTLGAALANPTSSALPARCAADVANLRQLLEGQPLVGISTVGDLVSSARDHAAAIGLELRVLVPAENDATPVTQATALAEVISEALTNVAKHSGVDRAELSARVDSQGIDFVVSDHGKGWHADASHGFGTTKGYAAPGIDVAISNRRSGGLTVSMRTSRGPANAPLVTPVQTRESIFHDLLVPVARSLAFWLIGLSGAVMVITWPEFPAWWWLLVALLGTCIPMTLINIVPIHPALNWTVCLLLGFSVLLLVIAPLMIASSSPVCVIPAATVVIVAGWCFGLRALLTTLTGAFLGLLLLAIASPDFSGSAALACFSFGAVVAVSAVVVVMRQAIERHAGNVATAIHAQSCADIESSNIAGQQQAREQLAAVVDRDLTLVLDELSAETIRADEPVTAARIARQERNLRILIGLSNLRPETRQFVVDVMSHVSRSESELALSGFGPDVAVPFGIAEEVTLLVGGLTSPTENPVRVQLSFWSAGSENGIMIVTTPLPPADCDATATPKLHEFTWARVARVRTTEPEGITHDVGNERYQHEHEHARSVQT